MRKCEIDGQGCTGVCPIWGFGEWVFVYVYVELISGFCLM